MELKDLFEAATMSFHQALSGVRMVDEQLGQRWERGAQVDLEFGYTSLFTDKPTVDDSANWVETVSPITEGDGTLIIQE